MTYFQDWSNSSASAFQSRTKQSIVFLFALEIRLIWPFTYEADEMFLTILCVSDTSGDTCMRDRNVRLLGDIPYMNVI